MWSDLRTLFYRTFRQYSLSQLPVVRFELCCRVCHRRVTYNGVASGVSSDIVTTLQLLEARLGHIGSKNFSHFGFISGFLQGVRKSSDPSEMSLGCEIFKENGAFVGMAENTIFYSEIIIFSLSHLLSGHTLVAVLLSRTELGRGQGHQGRQHGDSHLTS